MTAGIRRAPVRAPFATTAIEDKTFWENSGFDPIAFISAASGRRRRPAGVSATCRAPRSNSGVPSARSSDATRRLSVDCSTPLCLAASLMLPARATARK